MSNFVAEENGYDVKTVESQMIKCDSCGSNLVYNADIGKLYCEHCGSEKEIVSDSALELDLLSALDQERQWEQDSTNVFSCDNCGAKIVLAKDQTSASCPFCGTAHVQLVTELNGVKPNAVLPFKFGDDRAVKYSKDWARKRWFAPNKFKKNISTQNVKGIYVPCFTFDSSTFSTYDGRIGVTRTRTVGSGKNKRTQVYTVWRNIRGTYAHSFDDVLTTAGTKFDQKNLNKISPFQTNESVEYEEKYLLGYMAYHYDYEVRDCWNSAKSSMDKSIRNGILSQYVHDKVAYLNVSTEHTGVRYKYAMLPVYVGNYKYNGKLYNFYVNGESGKVSGKTPKSVWKILLTVLISIGIVVGIVALKKFLGE